MSVHDRRAAWESKRAILTVHCYRDGCVSRQTLTLKPDQVEAEKREQVKLHPADMVYFDVEIV